MKRKVSQKTNGAKNELRAYSSFCDQMGWTKVTGWRVRKRGWLKVVNICGRNYITDAEIGRFTARAEAGDFAQEHTFPRKAA